MSINAHDLSYAALSLPEEIKMYHYAGNFEGEIAAIDRFLRRSLPVGLRKRLELQKLFASHLKGEYHLTRADVVQRLRMSFPAADDALLDQFISSGNVDYILVGGAMRFQGQAVSNMLLTHKAELEKKQNPAYICPDRSTVGHECILEMKEKGGIAYRYTVEEEIRIKPHAERPGELLRIWLPYPVACASQPEKDIQLLASSHPVKITGTVRRTAYMEVPCEKDAVYSVRFSFVNRAKYTDLSAHTPTGLPAGDGLSPQELEIYTAEQAPHIRFTPFIRSLAEEIRGNETDSLRLARRVYEYIADHVRYSYVRDYLVIDNLPEYVLINGYGDCGTMALAFITLCRALGIPAKWQSGSSCSPDGIGSHDWAMFYIAPYGWLYCDPSYGEGAERNHNDLRKDHYFGNLDAFRMVAQNEFQQPFSPEKTMFCMDPYDNQSGEAEYADGIHNIFFEDEEHSRRVISAEKLSWK